MSQIAQNPSATGHARAISRPMTVATPWPRLNLSQTGNRWPRKAPRAAAGAASDPAKRKAASTAAVPFKASHTSVAAATLVCDALKGTAAVLAAFRFAGSDAAPAAALGAFLGHLFPVWLKFRRGQGVATVIGLLIALAWPVALGFCAIWLIVAAATRYSSLAALIASAATPMMLWAFGAVHEALLFAALVALLWVTHRANIARLLAGTEGKIGATACP